MSRDQESLKLLRGEIDNVPRAEQYPELRGGSIAASTSCMYQGRIAAMERYLIPYREEFCVYRDVQVFKVTSLVVRDLMWK
jgi:hypothetical protein